ncbi:hypothetical protein SUDANB146_01611 [Streptomyces sp. enrichment culture]
MTLLPADPVVAHVDFIEAMWQVADWQDVARRYAAAEERGGGPLLEP